MLEHGTATDGSGRAFAIAARCEPGRLALRGQWHDALLATFASPFVLDIGGMLTAVWQVRSDPVDASKVASGPNDSRVDVKVPLVIDELEGTVKEEVPGAALDGNGRRTAGHWRVIVVYVKFYRDNVA